MCEMEIFSFGIHLILCGFGDLDSLFWNVNVDSGDWEFMCFASNLGFWRCGFLVDLLEMEIFGCAVSSVLLLICIRVLMFVVQKRS